MKATEPIFRLTYNSREITRDITPYVESIAYVGEVGVKSDTLDIVVEDTAKLWQNNWYPVKGDKIVAEIGYRDLLVNVGVFVVDEIELAGPPDKLTIRAIATSFARAMRTKNSVAHEGKTLQQIVQAVAAKNGLTVEGDVPARYIRRVNQYQETDLNFLQRLAGDYACVFSVRGDRIIFTLADDLEARDSTLSIDRTELSTWAFTDKTAESYSRVTVTYQDPKSGKTITGQAEEAGGVVVPVVPATAWVDPLEAASYIGADAIEVRNRRLENEGQAKAMARSILRQNYNRLTGTITIEGDPTIMEGANLDITGLGAMSGRFHVKRAEHRIDTGGYLTTLEVKRTAGIDKSRWAPKKVVQLNSQNAKL